jgi:hypothetical protein
MDVSRNQLTGTIPSPLPGRLRFLDATFNQLSGPVPAVVPGSVLHYLLLGENNLSGLLPVSLINGAAAQLEFLDIRGNNLEGRLDGSSPEGGSPPGGGSGSQQAAAAASPAAASTGKKLLLLQNAAGQHGSTADGGTAADGAAAAAAAKTGVVGLEMMMEPVRLGRVVLQQGSQSASPSPAALAPLDEPAAAAAAGGQPAATGQPWTGLNILGYVDLSGNKFSGEAAVDALRPTRGRLMTHHVLTP